MEKRRFGNMVTYELRKCENIKEKAEYFSSLYSNTNEVKVNFAVFNTSCQCVKIQKCVTIFDLLRYISWNGFRGAVDQILLKLKYAIEGGNDTVYNICLARDFNLNILVLKDKSIETAIAVGE